MPFAAKPLTLTEEEQDELHQVSLSRTLPAGDVFRARLILMLAAGRSYKDIQQRLSTTAVSFLKLVGRCKPKQEIHVILDNLSAHKTNKVAEFLEKHPNVKLHFTPTYSSWLNQVEIWFARIEREVIARGVFASVKDLARKLMRYIRAYSKDARPFRWTYSDTSRRIKC
jgi:transposase